MTEVAVVGAGVVGLACAASLSARGFGVTVIEREARVAQGISARNSGVIHAGLYYPVGSLKAQTCVLGRERLYARAAAYAVPHRRTGKLVVAASPAEAAALTALYDRGRDNGAGALTLIDGVELERLEPRVRGDRALWSPETGIVDAYALAKSYEAEAVRHGAVVVLNTRVEALEPAHGGWRLRTVAKGGDRFALEVDVVVNSAGLGAVALFDSVGRPATPRRTLHLCKGDYFALAPALGRLTTHLVYPLPDAHGLGVHVTFDLGGRYRLGPDTAYVDRERYDVEPEKAAGFLAAARYLPELRLEHLSPDFAGLRPKLQGPDDGFVDFVIEEGTAAGVPGLVSLLGIESPGLTAAGEIGERVAALVRAVA